MGDPPPETEAWGLPRSGGSQQRGAGRGGRLAGASPGRGTRQTPGNLPPSGAPRPPASRRRQHLGGGSARDPGGRRPPPSSSEQRRSGGNAPPFPAALPAAPARPRGARGRPRFPARAPSGSPAAALPNVRALTSSPPSPPRLRNLVRSGADGRDGESAFLGPGLLPSAARRGGRPGRGGAQAGRPQPGRRTWSGSGSRFPRGTKNNSSGSCGFPPRSVLEPPPFGGQNGGPPFLPGAGWEGRPRFGRSRL